MLVIDCDLTMGWNDRLCAKSVGGIRRVVPVPITDLDYDSLVITANEITTFDLLSGGGYMYELEQNLSSYTAPPMRSERGSVTVDINLNMVLNNNTKELRAEIMALARNTCVWFVEQSDKTWVCLGLYDGLRLGDGNEAGSGVTKTDANGFSLNFVGQEVVEVPDVDDTLIAGLLASESSS
jgi:hypothetical protein